MHVLMMDDDASRVQGVASMLKAEPCHVFATGRGEEGVELAKLYDYDVILLALNLPDMSCHDALCALRAAKVKAPALILSDFGGMGDKLRSLGFSADDCLAQPLEQGDLIARVREAAQRHSADAGDPMAGPRQTRRGMRGLGSDLIGDPLLALLMRHKGATLTEDMIFNVLADALRQKRAEAGPFEDGAAPLRNRSA